ncbi:MAG: hypothetical protein DRI88_09410 [Bacteroidetes bacterium]|nr:MAG: hypothetical protein DRI88_09410 [Bacteroidota bacterium]
MNKLKVEKEPLFIRIVRILLGLVFIFSSFGKGVDPLGTAYRVEDYLIAYGMEWIYPLAFTLAVLLITVEFLIGVALLLKLQKKVVAWGVLLIMLFFTVVTYFDARYNLVPDCGCFGDALKLSNWVTFYKNIVLVVLAFIVFFGQKKITVKMPGWLQTVLLFLLAGGFVWFIFYNYNHLPMLDFRDWKVGNNMKNSGEENIKTYVTYRNKETGELKEYLSPEYPWNDSVWMKNWEFVDQRFDESGVVRKHTLFIEDEEGNDVTQSIIENPDYQLMLTTYDLDKANGGGMIKASELYHSLDSDDISFVLLSSSAKELVDKYKKVYSIDYEVYYADDIELKAMIRSNPGLVLLHDGTVLKKWHYNDFPDKIELKRVLTDALSE